MKRIAQVELTGNTSADYYLFGHSAGAQFVHRLLLMVPDGRYAALVAANAGWYTVPDKSIDYPYGLGLTPAGNQPFTFFEQRLVVMVGTLDNDPNAPNLRHTPEAERQGQHRYARAYHFYDQSATKAEELGIGFRWELVDVVGVGHQTSQMALAAADHLLRELHTTVSRG